MDGGILIYVLLFSGALLAGFVDSIAGGGGIITVPLLMLAGIPPQLSIATNKLQAVFGSLTSMIRYRQGGLFSFRSLIPGIVATAIGAVIGAVAMQFIPTRILKIVILVVLPLVFLYTLLSPDMGKKESRAKIPKIPFYCSFGLLLGFYDGFFGPGTGSFWTLGIVLLLGLQLKNATGVTKVMNFCSNAVSLIVFLFLGKVLLLVGLVMGLGQLAGAWLGTHLVLKKGTFFIRIFFLLVVAATIINLYIREFIL